MPLGIPPPPEKFPPPGKPPEKSPPGKVISPWVSPSPRLVLSPPLGAVRW